MPECVQTTNACCKPGGSGYSLPPAPVSSASFSFHCLASGSLLQPGQLSLGCKQFNWCSRWSESVAQWGRDANRSAVTLDQPRLTLRLPAWKVGVQECGQLETAAADSARKQQWQQDILLTFVGDWFPRVDGLGTANYVGGVRVGARDLTRRHVLLVPPNHGYAVACKGVRAGAGQGSRWTAEQVGQGRGEHAAQVWRLRRRVPIHPTPSPTMAVWPPLPLPLVGGLGAGGGGGGGGVLPPARRRPVVTVMLPAWKVEAQVCGRGSC